MKPKRLGGSLAVLVLGSALYGAVLGSWRGATLALYSAAKLPLVLIVTTLLSLVFGFLVAVALGERLSLRAVVHLHVSAFAVAALLLASLAPVAALFTWTLAAPSPAARETHNLLYLLHTALIGACGLAGVASLRGELRARCSSPAAASRLAAAWVLTLALVGGEVAWALRPFVGSVYEPVSFVRPNAFDGNVYEFIVTDIVPYLLRDRKREEESHERSERTRAEQPAAKPAHPSRRAGRVWHAPRR
jgi:hypothetical protein